jgi:hypothetical protein
MEQQIIDDFIKELVDQLERENNDRSYHKKKLLNIPYIIAPLVQHLISETYKDFLKDISSHSYFINYFDDNTEGYSNGYIEVNLYNKSEEDCDDYYNPECELHNYKIVFGKDQRHWGYCQCVPEDEDYRKDKDCCGHGCDWTAPTFKIEKTFSLGQNSWVGDQHNYWDFEDNFYASDKKLAEEKAKRDKEERIKYLQENIEIMQKELSEIQ